MNPDTAANLIAVFVLGLFVGTNLGVLLMCLLRMASPEPEPEARPASPQRERVR